MQNRIVVGLWFYIAWFGCVYCGLNDLSAVTLTFPIVSFFLLHRIEPLKTQKTARLLLLAALGVGFDFIAMKLSLITFLQNNGVFPLWLVSMWLLFVAILPLTEFLIYRPILAAVLGAIFGPLSYISGKMLGVLLIKDSTALIAYALFWALFFPLSLNLQKGKT